MGHRRVAREKIVGHGQDLVLRTSELFPEFDGHQGPFPKQEKIFELTRSGAMTGGGAVFCGGKGSGKTFTGAAWIIWIHHVQKWQGCRTLIGRETYPAGLTSTFQEFMDMVPQYLVESYSRPQKNAMGYVEWKVGGVTLMCSLSDSSTWESANLGAAWVDEAHRQNPKIFGDLLSRLRQANAPRACLATTNPAGHSHLWKRANPESKEREPNWHWVHASSLENPALPADYNRRLETIYKPGSAAHDRWVLGLSSALEGTVFDQFVAEPGSIVHVIPPFEIDPEWTRGRGLDFGVSHPTVVVWGAKSPGEKPDIFIHECHYQSHWAISDHAAKIIELDGERGVEVTPADPSIFDKTHYDRLTGMQFSTAEEFWNNGVSLTAAKNDRQLGLATMLELIAVDPTRHHFATLELGAPRLYLFDLESMEPLIQEFLNLQWSKPEGTPESAPKDDVRKKNDDGYDATRYLVMDLLNYEHREPVQRKHHNRATSRGMRRTY